MPVPAGPDGLPSAVGVTGGVVRVPANLLDGLAAGAAVVRNADGGSTPLTVRSVELPVADEAVSRTGPVLVAASDTGRRHVAVLG